MKHVPKIFLDARDTRLSALFLFSIMFLLACKCYKTAVRQQVLLLSFTPSICL